MDALAGHQRSSDKGEALLAGKDLKVDLDSPRRGASWSKDKEAGEGAYVRLLSWPGALRSLGSGGR